MCEAAASSSWTPARRPRCRRSARHALRKTFHSARTCQPNRSNNRRLASMYRASISTSTGTTQRGVSKCPPFFPSALANCVRKYSETRSRMSFERFSVSPSPIVPISSPKRCLSSAGRPKSFGKIPLSRGLSRSMETIASSISLPIVGGLALSCRCCQRASADTQKTLSWTRRPIGSSVCPNRCHPLAPRVHCECTKASVCIDLNDRTNGNLFRAKQSVPLLTQHTQTLGRFTPSCRLLVPRDCLN